MSGLENMIENKLGSYCSLREQDSLIFYRLRDNMEVLQDDLHLLRQKYPHHHQPLLDPEKELKQTATFNTPMKSPRASL